MGLNLQWTRRSFVGSLGVLTGSLLNSRRLFSFPRPSLPPDTKITGFGSTGNVYEELGVTTGGGTMDSILQLTVFLANIDHYDGMNSVFKTYFPKGGPARTTVAVAALPGKSLVEINCTAAVVK